MADPVDSRLRAARPPAADVDPDAFDAALLAAVRREPAPRPRSRSRILGPAAGLAVVAAVAAVLLVSPGGPSAPPTAAAAVRQARVWFEPPAGKVLHIRSVMTSHAPDGGSTSLVQENWQSVDDPSRERHLESQDGITSESVDGDIYDPATDTIYEEVPPGPNQKAALRKAIAAKIQGAKETGAPPEVVARIRADGRELLARDVVEHPEGEPVLGDPTAVKVRLLLRRGEATLGDPVDHDGVRALPITLTAGPPGDGQPRTTLWTAADDGRPLELRIDSGPGTDVLETVRWTTYELLADDPALLDLAEAHPGATVVRDPDAYDAATARLYPHG